MSKFLNEWMTAHAQLQVQKHNSIHTILLERKVYTALRNDWKLLFERNLVRILLKQLYYSPSISMS